MRVLPVLRPWSAPLLLGVAIAVPAVAFAVARPVGAASTAAGTATVSVPAKAPAAAALRRGHVRVAAVRPLQAAASRWRLPVRGPVAPHAASAALGGGLRFVAGKRRVSFTGLRLTLGRHPAVTGAYGKRRLTILTVGAAPKVAAGTVRFAGARVSLAPAAGKALKRGLRLKRAPGGRLGTLSLTVRTTAPPVVTTTTTTTTTTITPPPVTTTTTTTTTTPPPVTTTTTTTTTPPPAPCDGDPAGTTAWVASDEPGGSSFGSGNLRSWINYILSPIWGGGSVTASGGAVRVDDAVPYDYDLVACAATTEPDGSVTIPHAGRIAYALPVHDVDDYVEDLTFHVSPDRTTATVDVDARYAARDDPSQVVTGPLDGVMTVDLTAATSTVDEDGVTVYTHAPAALTANGQEIWTTAYAVGAPWGAFTIAVPDPQD